MGYIYYYWNFDKGLNGIEGWDIRAVSPDCDPKVWQPLFARFGSLHYGSKDMQEYVYRMRDRWTVFRVCKITSINQRDDKACAVSWPDEEKVNYVCFPQKKLHHDEYATGILEEPPVVSKEAGNLPGKEFWSLFVLYLWKKVISSASVSSCLLLTEAEEDMLRKTLNLIVCWLPGWMKEQFSAVLTKEMVRKEPVRLCIAYALGENLPTDVQIIRWNCPDSIPKVKGRKKETEEGLLQMLGDWYELYQKDYAGFEESMQRISDLSQEQQNLNAVRECDAEYRMKILEENVERQTQTNSKELWKLLHEVNGLLGELEEAENDEEFLQEGRSRNVKNTDTREDRKHVRERLANHVVSRGLHKVMESYSRRKGGRRRN